MHPLYFSFSYYLFFTLPPLPYHVVLPPHFLFIHSLSTTASSNFTYSMKSSLITLIHVNFSFFFQKAPEIALTVNGGGYDMGHVALENNLFKS